MPSIMPSIIDGVMPITTEAQCEIINEHYGQQGWFRPGHYFYWSPNYPDSEHYRVALRLLEVPPGYRAPLIRIDPVSGLQIRPQWAGTEPAPLPLPG